MRVLYVSDNTSDHNRCFLEKLAEAAVEVWFLDPTADPPAPGWLPEPTRWVSIRRKPRPHAPPAEFARCLPEVQARLEEIKPDLIHAGPTHSAGYITALTGFHPWLVASWGWDVLYQPELGTEWKDATQLALTRADAFLCDCDAVRNKMLEFTGLDHPKIVQFPWGIRRGTFTADGPQVDPSRFHREPGAKVFLTTRSWEPIYAVDVLLEAFRQAHLQDPALRLIMLGQGSLETQVRHFIRHHGLDRVIHTPGQVSRAEIPKWFRVADGYVSCSKTDSTSISLLEAMATGLPVVVTDIPSNREWVSEGHNGWLAPAGSPEQFAAKLLQAAALTRDQRRGFAERNQQVVERRADWDSNFPRLIEMYQQMIAREVAR